MAAVVAAVTMAPLWGAPGRRSSKRPRPSSRLLGPLLDAKAKAEENDAAGNLVAALQYYLEYVRQAEGLASPVRVAWGKNNAAYMIIKMHRLDPRRPGPGPEAPRGGLSHRRASEDCRRSWHEPGVRSKLPSVGRFSKIGPPPSPSPSVRARSDVPAPGIAQVETGARP